MVVVKKLIYSYFHTMQNHIHLFAKLLQGVLSWQKMQLFSKVQKKAFI